MNKWEPLTTKTGLYNPTPSCTRERLPKSSTTVIGIDISNLCETLQSQVLLPEECGAVIDQGEAASSYSDPVISSLHAIYPALAYTSPSTAGFFSQSG